MKCDHAFRPQQEESVILARYVCEKCGRKITHLGGGVTATSKFLAGISALFVAGAGVKWLDQHGDEG
jgi:hypothetical protein